MSITKRLSAIAVLIATLALIASNAGLAHDENAKNSKLNKEQLNQASEDSGPANGPNDELAKLSSDVMIGSMEDDQLPVFNSIFGAKTHRAGVSNKLRYEQSSTTTEPPGASSSSTQASTSAVSESTDTAGQASKLIEPRNQQELNGEQPANELLIIDHRPQDQSSETSLSASSLSSTTPASVTSTTPQSQANAQATIAQQQQQQPQLAWQTPNGLFYTTSTQQQVAAQQPLGSASNQMVSVVQHPNSINSIISEQQQQVQSHTAANGPQMMALNGQQAPVILLGQSSNGQMITSMATVPNARRISISNWFKGLSSMLANIFNRREHGNQLQASGSSTQGHWIQLGPNAPHWLTQAQSAIQQFQQASSQPNRFTSFIQGSTPFMQQQPQSINAIGTSMMPQAQASTSSLAKALPPGNIAAAFIQQPQQQQQQSSGSQLTVQNGDLQTSGSSTNYLTIQPAPSAMIALQNPTQAPGQVAPGYQMAQAQQYVVGQLQPSINNAPATTVASGKLQETSNRQQNTVQTSNGQAAGAASAISNGQNQQATTSTHNRFGRSSPAQQQQSLVSKAQPQSNTRTQSLVTQTTDGNHLPLAHYSTQYTVSQSD